MRLTKYINTLIRVKSKNDTHWYAYLFFAALRIILVFIPQLGYIHPDEFFQTVEPLLGDQFQIEHKRTWEFNNTFPLRSIAIQYFVIKIPLSFLDFLSVYAKYYFQLNLKTSYVFLVYPRLLYCCLSFLNDWSLYKICEVYSLRYEIRLLALSSSFVMLVFSTRTFSNTLEMALCSVLLYLASDCMIKSNTIIYKKEFLQDKYQKATSTSEKVRLYKLKAALPTHSYSRAALMSNLCVIGIFNRPTFIIFGTPIVFFWMLRGLGTKTVSFVDFNIRMFLFISFTIPALCFFIFIDSLYYKYLTLGEIHMLDISINNFIFTPWNFVKYNLDSNRTAEHGLHSKYTHALINIPLLYNVLGLIAFCSFGMLVYRFLRGQYRYLPRSQSIIVLMSSAIFIPLGILSMINHQEARFLLPLTLPIILLHSPKLVTGFCTSYPFKMENQFLRLIYNHLLCTKASSKYLLRIWYIINLFLTIFFGFIHQGGVFQLAQNFSHVMEIKPRLSHVHLVTSHIYMMPISFVNTPSSNILHVSKDLNQKYYRNKEFYLYEYGSLDLDKLIFKVKLILDVCEMKYIGKNLKYQLYLAIPSSLNNELNSEFEKTNNEIINYQLEKIFYPHLSTEAIPDLVNWWNQSCLTLNHHNNDDDDDDDDIGFCEINDGIIGIINNLSLQKIKQKLMNLFNQFGLALYRIEKKQIKM